MWLTAEMKRSCHCHLTACTQPQGGRRSYDGGVEVVGGRPPDVLTPEALAFVSHLHRQFNSERRRLLAARAERQARFDAGERPGFSAATRAVRHRAWNVAPVPKDLIDRRVEIAGPAERKM